MLTHPKKTKLCQNHGLKGRKTILCCQIKMITTLTNERNTTLPRLTQTSQQFLLPHMLPLMQAYQKEIQINKDVKIERTYKMLISPMMKQTYK